MSYARHLCRMGLIYIDRWTFFLNPSAVIIIRRMKYAPKVVSLGFLMENSTKNGRQAKNHTTANLINRQLFFIR